MRQFPDDYALADGLYIPKEDAGAHFNYNDGDEAETRIHAIVKSAVDRSVQSRELAANITDWPSLYHLSARRANLLRPIIELLQKGPVLEVGAGCGAITRYLAETGCEVVSVEGSRRRSQIAHARVAEFAKVSVVCDEVSSMKFDAPFQSILVVGVLEYARIYAGGEAEFLEMLVRNLAEDGVIIIAIENQLGIKYFNGSPEDHTGKPFFGINDLYTSSTAVTFGRHELSQILRDGGLGKQSWYIPCPDYKLPSSIVRGDCRNIAPTFDAGTFMAQTANNDPQRPHNPILSMEMALDLLHRNNLTVDLANSFLVIAERESKRDMVAVSDDTIAWHYSSDRHRAFVVETKFVKQADGIVVKRHLLDPGHDLGLPIKCQPIDGEYIRGRHWWMELVRIVNTPGWTVGQIANWARVWIEALISKLSLERTEISASKIIPGQHFDATPFNLIVEKDGAARFFDQEWILDSTIELGYLLARGLGGSLSRITSVAEPAEGTSLAILDLVSEILSNAGIVVSRTDVYHYWLLEPQIQAWVQGEATAKSADPTIQSLADWRLRSRSLKEHEVQRLEVEHQSAVGEATNLRAMLETERKQALDVRATLEGERQRALDEVLTLRATLETERKRALNVRATLEAEKQRALDDARALRAASAVELKHHSRLLAAERQALAKSRTELEAARRDLDQVRNQLSSMETSTAWRVTQPLRRFLAHYPSLRRLGRQALGLSRSK